MTETDIPKIVRVTMSFIDRVGFPVVAFFLMCYMCFVTLKNVTMAITDMARAMTMMSVEFKQHDESTRRALKSIGADDE